MDLPITPLLNVIHSVSPGFYTENELMGVAIHCRETGTIIGSYDSEINFLYLNLPLPIQEYGDEFITVIRDCACLDYISLGKSCSERHDAEFIKRLVWEAKIPRVLYFVSEKLVTLTERDMFSALMLHPDAKGSYAKLQSELRGEIIRLLYGKIG